MGDKECDGEGDNPKVAESMRDIDEFVVGYLAVCVLASGIIILFDQLGLDDRPHYQPNLTTNIAENATRNATNWKGDCGIPGRDFAVSGDLSVSKPVYSLGYKYIPV
jgi:hypothetical protein